MWSTACSWNPRSGDSCGQLPQNVAATRLDLQRRQLVGARAPEIDDRNRYAALLRADQENRTLLWGGGRWRHWWLSDGQLVERPAPKPVEAPVAEPVANDLELVG